MRDREIIIVCPENAEFKQQEVGENGNPNMYYMTFTTYLPEGTVTFKEGDTGVLKDEVLDKVVGLELGADDFVVKPFDMKELSARIKAVLRRCQSGAGQNDDEVIKFENIEISLQKYELKLRDNDPASFGAPDIGSFMHGVLEKTVKWKHRKTVEVS